MSDAEQSIYFFQRSVKLLITKTMHSVDDKNMPFGRREEFGYPAQSPEFMLLNVSSDSF